MAPVLVDAPAAEEVKVRPLCWATIWQGVPGPLGAPGQLVQLLSCVQLPTVGAAPCLPAYGWGQQVVMGMLVPNQPVGWALVRGEPLHPTVSCPLHVPAYPAPPRHVAASWHSSGYRGHSVLQALSSSTHKPSEASNKAGQ